MRAGSNYGASRSFVFGSDPSNHGSNPGAAAAAGTSDAAKAPVGPSSFASLSKLIPEAAANKNSGGAGRASTAATRQAVDSVGLLNILHRKGPAGAHESGPHGLMQKQHLDAAVGVSFRMANGGRAGNSNAAVSSHGPWQF